MSLIQDLTVLKNTKGITAWMKAIKARKIKIIDKYKALNPCLK
tara:strand:- start:219 stop:347 length:129 start_codon:yes stop_codon:yes gene_type:complete